MPDGGSSCTRICRGCCGRSLPTSPVPPRSAPRPTASTKRCAPFPLPRALIQQAIEEALAVGRASGAPIMEDSLEWAMNSLDRFPAQGRASMAKDFTEGRAGGAGRVERGVDTAGAGDRDADAGQRFPVRGVASAGGPDCAGVGRGLTAGLSTAPSLPRTCRQFNSSFPAPVRHSRLSRESKGH